MAYLLCYVCLRGCLANRGSGRVLHRDIYIRPCSTPKACSTSLSWTLASVKLVVSHTVGKSTSNRNLACNKGSYTLPCAVCLQCCVTRLEAAGGEGQTGNKRRNRISNFHSQLKCRSAMTNQLCRVAEANKRGPAAAAATPEPQGAGRERNGKAQRSAVDNTVRSLIFAN